MHKDNAKTKDAPGFIYDGLTELLRLGARELIEKAVETELQYFLSQYDNVTDLKGRKSVVRNGYLPEREVLTGIGPIEVRVPKVRDRSGGGLATNPPSTVLGSQDGERTQRIAEIDTRQSLGRIA